jgi:hypothetical protein
LPYVVLQEGHQLAAAIFKLQDQGYLWMM